MADHKLSAVLELKDQYSAKIKKSTSVTMEFSKINTSAVKNMEKEWNRGSTSVTKYGTQAFTTVGKSAVEEARKIVGGFKTIEKGAVQAAATVAEKPRSAFQKFTNSAVKAGKEAGKGLKDGVVNATKSIPSAIAGTLKGLGKGMAMGLGMGVFSSLTGMISSAIGTAKNTIVSSFFQYADIEDQIIRNQNIMGATDEEAIKLKKQVNDLGATTIYTAKEVAQAQKYQAMAGYSANEVLRVTPTLLKLANASGEDLARTSDIVTDNLTAFGLGVKDTERFCDVLAITANRTNTSVSELGESFKYIAANSRGKEAFEDVALMLGVLANNGIKGSKAGRNLSAIYTRLAKETPEMNKQLAKTKTKLYNKDGSQKSLLEVIKSSKKELDKMSAKDRNLWLATIAGDTGMAIWNSLANTSEEEFEKVRQSIENCDGALENFNAELAKKSPKYAIAMMSSAWDGFKNKLGQAVAPVALEWMDKLTKYLDSDTFSTENIENFFNTIVDYAREVQPVLGAVWDALKGIASIVSTGQEKKRYEEQRKNIDLLTAGMSTPGGDYTSAFQASKDNGSFKSAFSTEGLSEERANKINKAKEEQALRYIQFAIRRKNDSQEFRDEYNRIQSFFPNMKLEDVWNNHKWGKGVQTAEKYNAMKGIFGETGNPMEILKGYGGLKLQNDEPTKVEHDLKAEPFQFTLKIDQDLSVPTIESIFKKCIGNFTTELQNDFQTAYDTQS